MGPHPITISGEGNVLKVTMQPWMVQFKNTNLSHPLQLVGTIFFLHRNAQNPLHTVRFKKEIYFEKRKATTVNDTREYLDS